MANSARQPSMMIFFVLLLQVCMSVADLDLFKPQANKCEKSSINYNVTLSQGTKAGKFYKLHDVHEMAGCIGRCCGAKKCDVAFMVNKNCYLVGCHSAESCVVKKSENAKFSTLLSVVSKSETQAKEDTESKDEGEPAIEGNLQGVAPGTKSESPFVVDKDDDMTTLSAFGTGTVKRSKRSSDILDLVVAIGCGTVAAAVGVAGVIVMTRRLVEKKRGSSA